LRNNQIACEIFHEPAKFDKQFKYADKKSIPFAIIIGEEELANKTVMVKNLITGKQEVVTVAALPTKLSV
jgi:histidyl-tRNA synthetase